MLLLWQATTNNECLGTPADLTVKICCPDFVEVSYKSTRKHLWPSYCPTTHHTCYAFVTFTNLPCLFSQPLQRIENEVELLGEQLSVGGGFSYAHHHHHHHHHQPPSTLPPSTPLQFLSHHDPLSQELFTMVNIIITWHCQFLGIIYTI